MIGQDVAYELNCLDVTQCRMAIMERWVCLSLDVGVGQQHSSVCLVWRFGGNLIAALWDL